MNKIIISFLLLFAISFSGYCETEKSIDVGELNGRTWKVLNKEDKTMYVCGFGDGLLYGSVVTQLLLEGKMSKKDIEDFGDGYRRAASMEGLTCGDIVDKIDSVYEEPFNRNISVVWVYKNIHAQYLLNPTKEEQEERMRVLREIFKK